MRICRGLHKSVTTLLVIHYIHHVFSVFVQAYVNENPFYEQRLNLDKAAGISTAIRESDDKGKDDVKVEKQNRDSDKGDEVSAAERVKQQKRAIERQLREKEEEEERRKKELEDQAKKVAEHEKQSRETKEGTEKVRLELPATGKIGKMTWVKQQQRLQEKIKQRQEEAREREAAQQKSKLQFSFGRAPPTFQTGGAHGPRIDATTFIKKLKEEKERNKTQDQTSEPANLDMFLSVGDSSLPVVTEEIPLPKIGLKSGKTEAIHQPPPKSEIEMEREEDFKMLGIDPGSTSAMDISNKPPVMASRKPSSDATSPGAATSATSLYSVFNPSNKQSTTTTSNGASFVSSMTQESSAPNDIRQADEDNHQIDGKGYAHIYLPYYKTKSATIKQESVAWYDHVQVLSFQSHQCKKLQLQGGNTFYLCSIFS